MKSPEEYTVAQKAGARNLITFSLSLIKNENLQILVQREFIAVADCITLVAETLGVRTKILVFERSEFLGGNYPIAFAPEHMRAREPDGIALVMEWSDATTSGRLALLEHLKDAPQKWRVASMPGVDLDGLTRCGGNFDLVTSRCHDLFALMVRCDSLRIETGGPTQPKDILLVPLLMKAPFISTGKISYGGWGNFPSGETFVLPASKNVSGWITIDGSVPGMSLADGDWVRFQIRSGRIVYKTLTSSRREVLNQFVELFFTKYGRPKATNTNVVAEIGVGTNDSIGKLTGKPIFDEKKLGTFHIAFGRNLQFEGPIDSPVHHDLVCTNVNLYALDRHNKIEYAIILDGQYVVTREDAMPKINGKLGVLNGKLRTLSVRSKLCINSKPIHPEVKGSRKSLAHTDQFTLSYTSGNGIPIEIAAASDQYASLALRVFRTLDTSGPLTVAHLRRSLGRSIVEDVLDNVLSGLLTYNIIRRYRARL